MNIFVYLLLVLGAAVINSAPTSKVIGGIVVESIKMFPYQTAIFALQEENWAAFCSGSILSANFIVTCAHCLNGTHNASVFYGSELLSNLDFSMHQVVSSSNYRIHPKYSRFLNDIALMELPLAIKFSGNDSLNKIWDTLDIKRFGILPALDFVRPLQLPSNANENYENKQLLMASWGYYSEELTISNELRSSAMEIVPSSVCAELFGAPLITDSVICSNEMHCSGDSGAMLVDGDVAVGIASFSMGSCEEGKISPSVFMKVASYLDFIDENTHLVNHEKTEWHWNK